MTGSAMFWSCWIQTRFSNIEASTRKVLEKLGVPYRDMEGTSCCPEPFYTGLLDRELWLTMAARNITIAEALGLPVLTLCNGCYETLFEANEFLKENPEAKEKVNKELSKIGKKYQGTVEVKHLTEALYEQGLDRIKQAVVKPLTGIKVAVHPGCHLYRSKKTEDWYFKAEAFKELVKAIGAEVVDYKLERLCCGFPQRSFDEELSLTETLRMKLESVSEAGADLIAVVCPTCYLQFEVGQADLKSKTSLEFNIPVAYLSELLALSFGYKPEEVGLDLHRIPLTKLVERVG